MTQHQPPVRRNRLIARQRFMLAGSLVLAVLLPYALRLMLTDQGILLEASNVSALANLFAVIAAFWIRYSVATFPGARTGLAYLPSIAGAHAIVAAVILMLRIPYDRALLLAGFTIDFLWCMGLYLAVHARVRQSIAIVPIGNVAELRSIDWIQWTELRSPDVAGIGRFDSIVADFAADLPDEWEAFLADAALAGRPVFQEQQLMESLTGRVKLRQLSENSFGSLVPARAYFYIKSLVDWVAALLALPFLLLVIVPVALMIRFDSAGPVIFRQRRVGFGGRSFTVYKFRTMRVAREDETGIDAAITTEADQRITRLGRFLRRSRIDELPQVFNILRGEMSWIGPRPEADVLSSWYTSEVPFYRYRHVVKPGISGWAQVNQGHVADVDEIRAKLQYDFFYIKYFSLWLDLLIVFRTIRTMLSGFGAR